MTYEELKDFARTINKFRQEQGRYYHYHTAESKAKMIELGKQIDSNVDEILSDKTEQKQLF